MLRKIQVDEKPLKIFQALPGRVKQHVSCHVPQAHCKASSKILTKTSSQNDLKLPPPPPRRSLGCPSAGGTTRGIPAGPLKPLKGLRFQCQLHNCLRFFGTHIKLPGNMSCDRSNFPSITRLAAFKKKRAVSRIPRLFSAMCSFHVFSFSRSFEAQTAQKCINQWLGQKNKIKNIMLGSITIYLRTHIAWAKMLNETEEKSFLILPTKWVVFKTARRNNQLMNLTLTSCILPSQTYLTKRSPLLSHLNKHQLSKLAPNYPTNYLGELARSYGAIGPSWSVHSMLGSGLP